MTMHNPPGMGEQAFLQIIFTLVELGTCGSCGCTQVVLKYIFLVLGLYLSVCT